MGRLTAEERAQLDALAKRAKDEEDKDKTTELWVRNKDGHEIKLTGAEARKYKAKFGIEDDDDQAPADPGADDDEPDPEPAGAGGYFKSRK